MLKIILSRLKPQTEKIIAEEQAGFRAGRSTTEQIFNLRIFCEKSLQHQQDLYRVFIDFKKAFNRVWHAALWATMKKYNISTTLIQVIRNLYDKATSAVLFNSSIGDLFWPTVTILINCPSCQCVKICTIPLALVRLHLISVVCSWMKCVNSIGSADVYSGRQSFSFCVCIYVLSIARIGF